MWVHRASKIRSTQSVLEGFMPHLTRSATFRCSVRQLLSFFGRTGPLFPDSLSPPCSSFQYMLIFIFGLIVTSDGMNMVVISVLYTTLHDEWGLTQLQEGLLAGVVFIGPAPP